MYCDKCNTRLMGNENYCSYCGNKINKDFNNNYVVTDNKTDVKSTENSRSASVVLGIISLCGVLFFGIFAPISLVLSIVGLVLAIKANKNVKNAPGIILNSISLFLSFILTMIIFLALLFSFNIIKDAWNDEIKPSIYEEYNDNYGDF